jgi:hypothetical protein
VKGEPNKAIGSAFVERRRRQRPIEYGVIAAGLALALMAILGQIGGALNTAF